MSSRAHLRGGKLDDLVEPIVSHDFDGKPTSTARERREERRAAARELESVLRRNKPRSQYWYVE
jgi:hypothetical protein